MAHLFLKQSYPRAILHLDADAFFASVEVAKNPTLKGKPVVTGEERGIATAISYEARKFGITRATPIRDIRKNFPEVIIIGSDYESYALYSRRMMEVVRRYTTVVEEYSIDECFAELTGVRRYLNLSYEEIVGRIQKEIDEELGVSVSIGLGPTKVLAKVASKRRKPHGLTFIPGREIEVYLADTPVGYIWGIGRQTTAYFNSFGITTALQFAQMEEVWVNANLTKPTIDLWRELRGECVLPLAVGAKSAQKSIAKTETFHPATADRAFLLSELSGHLERACRKARGYHLAPKRIHCFIKTEHFQYRAIAIDLPIPTNAPGAIVELLEKHFHLLPRAGERYRASGVTLTDLREEGAMQEDLFGESTKVLKHESVCRVVDDIEGVHGRGTVFLASSFNSVLRHTKMRSARKHLEREIHPLKAFGLPLLGEVS